MKMITKMIIVSAFQTITISMVSDLTVLLEVLR